MDVAPAPSAPGASTPQCLFHTPPYIFSGKTVLAEGCLPAVPPAAEFESGSSSAGNKDLRGNAPPALPRASPATSRSLHLEKRFLRLHIRTSPAACLSPP